MQSGLDQHFLFHNGQPTLGLGCTDRNASIVAQQCSDDLPSVGTYSCLCPPLFSGYECQHVDNPCESRIAPCGVNRECAFSGPGVYSCPCVPGAEENMEVCTDFDECASAPCQNGATCRDSTADRWDGHAYQVVPLDEFVCECVVGYVGDTCADVTDLCDSPGARICGSHTNCSTTGGNRSSSVHTCTCHAGYETMPPPLRVRLGSAPQTYTAAQQFCEMREMDLCPREVYCP
eukprot:SAG22_NODE_7025_length_784_cov_1.713869_1_plen_232_part_01